MLRSEPEQDTVLVVDDEAMVREYVGSVLTRAGYRVIEASDGVEALTMIEQHDNHIAVVLLDLTMPKMDGLEVLRELRVRRPDLRVLLMTGHAPETMSAQLGESETTSLVRKPIGPTDLLERLNRLMTRQSKPLG